MKKPWVLSISSMLIVGAVWNVPDIAFEVATGSVHPDWSAVISMVLFFLAWVVVRKFFDNWTNTMWIGGLCLALAIRMVWRETASAPNPARHATALIVLSLIIGVALGISIHANIAELRARRIGASSSHA